MPPVHITGILALEATSAQAALPYTVPSARTHHQQACMQPLTLRPTVLVSHHHQRAGPAARHKLQAADLRTSPTHAASAGCVAPRRGQGHLCNALGGAWGQRVPPAWRDGSPRERCEIARIHGAEQPQMRPVPLCDKSTLRTEERELESRTLELTAS